jgi:hypothetical protein
MKKFGTPLRLTLCLSLLTAIAFGFPTTSQAAGPPSGIDVTVTNTPLPVQGTVNVGNFPASTPVTGSVSITGTPNVNVVNTPTVNIGNSLKPSQLVTVLNSSTIAAGTCSILGNILDTIQKSDGTTTAFSIPSGQVFVITAADLYGISATAGNQVSLRLRRVSATDNNTLAERSVTADSSGLIGPQAFNFPTGAVVTSGVSLCVSAEMPAEMPNTFFPNRARVYGYFAKDE